MSAAASFPRIGPLAAVPGIGRRMVSHRRPESLRECDEEQASVAVLAALDKQPAFAGLLAMLLLLDARKRRKASGSATEDAA
jgi:hypothetical protein